MRAAPAVAVTAGPDPARGLLRLLSALAVGVTALWALQRGDGLAAAVTGLVVAGVAWLLWRDRQASAQRLKWDGVDWWLAGPADAAEPRAGKVAVALDLDRWLLLRFRADGREVPASGPRTRWLAMRRHEHPAEWHALRCALYSPAASSGASEGP
ncbi:hypothetical protein C1M51_12340 [Methylibium sp. Pch-M]|uniref:hypothetical protein n=1 Tax=Methylibium sp. Pch-M TaxID=2082386 RepID=UPI001012AD6A|nr:hypothetical protein [Methylibium sp. Pch-M]QAZ40144.1 hypothetical protein C1M51_12340 [Methylibium sp. Pch-M]